MLDLFEVVNSQDALLSLPLQDVSSGIILKSIDGFAPVKATFVSSKFALRDGAQYLAGRRESRNILIKLSLDSRYGGGTVRDIRNNLYRFFMPNTPVILRFRMTSGLLVEIEGWVESYETDLFTKEPEATISVMCFDPDFVVPTTQTGSGTATTVLTTQQIAYSGTVNTGIDLAVTVGTATDGFTLRHESPTGAVRTMEIVSGLLPSDVVKISTSPGGKKVSLLRQGTESSILYAVVPQSYWVALEPGANELSVIMNQGTSQYTYSYKIRHGGL